MLVILYFTTGLLLIYAVLIGCYRSWWKAMPAISSPNRHPVGNTLKVSVIIPARNEEENILICLQSLLRQHYPAELMEIIVVNDHSTDDTVAVVERFPQVRLLHLSDYVKDPINSYKKKAIEVAIAACTGELIVTTDADCLAGPEWITTMAGFYAEKQAVFIAAGVKISTNGSLLSIFQSLDFLTLQGITGASVFKKFHSMCNGANMAYSKKAFYEVGGFTGIDKIASGDDMLLMHKIFLKYPDRVFFLKSQQAIVTTLPADSWKSFLHQRIRWASKADKYDDKRILLVLLLVYFLNLLLLVILLAGFAAPVWWLYAFLLITAKFLFELPFMWTISSFFGMRRLLTWFPFIQPLHIVYTVTAGFLGKFGSYQWKGRKVN